MIRIIKNNKYIMLFNTTSGKEILIGINNNDDPFILEMPSLIDIGIMGKCLNDCKICYQGNNIYSNHMTLDNFKMIVNQTKNSTFQYALGGYGDPNHHPNFKEIIEYCRKNNIIPNYTTSGNGITDDQIYISKLCGAVAVSEYNKDFTYIAINKFIESNIKTNIHFVLTSERFKRAIDILDGKDIWNNKIDLSKLNAVIFLLFKPKGKGENFNNLIPSNKQLKEFINKIRNKNTCFKIGMDSCLVNKISILDNLTRDEQIFLDTCEAGRSSMYITPDMYTVPCSFSDYKINGVRITKGNTISKIWNNSESFLYVRKKLLQNKNKCPYINKL